MSGKPTRIKVRENGPYLVEGDDVSEGEGRRLSLDIRRQLSDFHLDVERNGFREITETLSRCEWIV